MFAAVFLFQITKSFDLISLEMKLILEIHLCCEVTFSVSDLSKSALTRAAAQLNLFKSII